MNFSHLPLPYCGLICAHSPARLSLISHPCTQPCNHIWAPIHIHSRLQKYSSTLSYLGLAPWFPLLLSPFSGCTLIGALGYSLLCAQESLSRCLENHTRLGIEPVTALSFYLLSQTLPVGAGGIFVLFSACICQTKKQLHQRAAETISKETFGEKLLAEI